MSTPALVHEQPSLSADPEVIHRWLSILYAGSPGLISVCSDADGWAGRRFTTDEAGIRAAVGYAVALDRRHHPKGIYAQVTTLREKPASGRGGEDLAYGLTHLWADGDFGTIGHKPGPDDLPTPPDVEAVAKVVAESGLPRPTGWTYSGGGYNPVWLLAETHLVQDEEDRARIKELTSAWQVILGAQAYRYGWSWDSEVGNLDRLMKLPGTINRKEGLERPTAIGPSNGTLYALAELAQVAAEIAPSARELLAQAAQEKQERKAARLGHTAHPPRAPRPPRASSGDGPLDVLADMLEFRDVLEPAGFTYMGTNSDGREKWLRPAIGGDRPSSAYSLLCDDHVAVNWSERADLPVGAQPPGSKLTVGTLYAHLNYGGSTSEAASDIMRAAAGRSTGAAASLPLAVLAEVKRRCLRDESFPTAEPYDSAPQEDHEPSHDGWEHAGPARRRGHLPEDFWEARPVLRHIRQAAHARNRSGDLVLGGLLAREAALLPPYLQADTGVGSPASMNMFVILFGPPGSGKSSAGKIPQKLLPPPPNLDFLDGMPLGSGEGLAEAFMGEKTVETGEIYRSGPKKGDPKTETVRAQVRHNALFYADEGESLTKQLFGRSGATVGAAIRAAWVGETIGQLNGQKVNTRLIVDGSYSMGIAVGFQPETALPLLQDAAAGTPQRFLWVSSTDPSIPEDPVTFPGPLDLQLVKGGFGKNSQISFATDILLEIRRDDHARATGAERLPPLDAHKPLMLVKLSVLLAILDDRLNVTVEDWQLALVMWETSCEIRDGLIEYGARQQAEEAEKRTKAHVDREVRAHAAKAASDRDVERVAQRAAKRVHEAGGMTRGALNKAIAHRDRDRLGAAVDFAEFRGWITVEGDRIAPGDSRPS
ncbi:hypothetical protein ACGFIJ_30030 [Microbispora bryophytorum]|uniref:hypothetical protein n=1 Tax=Microbispora bryophytorum TaxID=1460882 RepID=UPI00371F07A5